MAIELISDVYDIKNLEAQHEKFISFLKESRNSIIDLNNMRISIKYDDLGTFAKKQQEVTAAINQSTAATQKAVTAKQQLTKAEIEARVANQQRTAAIKNEIAETNAAAGSYNQLQAQLKRLTDQYKSLGESERQGTQGKDIQKSIFNTKNQLKELDAGLGDHQRKVGSYADAIAGSFTHIFERALEFIGAYQIIEGLTSLIKGTATAAIEAEVATFRFKGTLDNLGRLDAFERIKKSAEALHEEFGFFEKPQIIGVFEQLATFGKLSENQINALTPVIINFAAKSGLSLKEATSNILAAIEGQGRGLKQYGINIKDAKTEADRFGIIMDELAPKVKGAAAAFGETTQGNIEKTKIRFKELQEEIGSKVLPTINALLSAFNNLLKDISSDGIGKVIGNTIKGIDIYLFEGYGALKKYQQLQKDIHAGIVGENGKPIAVLTQPRDTVVGSDNPFDPKSKGLSDVGKAKKDSFLRESLNRTAEFNKAIKDQLGKAGEEELKSLQDKYKKAYSDQDQSELDRLNSLQDFYDTSLQLNEKEKQRELAQNDLQAQQEAQKAKQGFGSSDKTIQEKRALATELNAIEAKRVATQQAIILKSNIAIENDGRDFATEAVKITKEGFAKDEKALSDHIALLKQLQKEKYDALNDKIDIGANEDATAKIQQNQWEEAFIKSAAKRRGLEEKLQFDLNGINKKASIEKLKISEDELEQELAKAILIKTPTDDIQKRITENQRTQAELRKSIDDDEYNHKKQKRDEELQHVQEFGNAIIDLEGTFGDAGFQKKKDKLQAESDLNDQKEKRDIEAVNASARSEQDKAAAISIIQARAAAEKTAIDAKQRKLDHDKAVFDKQIAILTIIAQIAIDLAKFEYGAAALAGIALIKLIATPIPKYKGGRGYGKDELAFVHPGEFIHRDGGIEATPGVESLTHLMPKDKVYPSKAAMMKELGMSALQLSNFHVNKEGNITVAMEKMTGRIEGAINDIKIHTTNITKEGWKAHNQRLADYNNWVEKYIKN